jgi:MFS family permease
MELSFVVQQIESGNLARIAINLMEEPSKSMLREIPRNVWITAVTSFLTDISSEMIFTLLPLFLANVLGVSTIFIGLIDGISETTSSFLKGYSGWLSDKLGQRKWLAVGGYALSSLAKPFLIIATSWYGILLVRFTDRAGKGVRTAPRDTLIADSVQENQRGIAFGIQRAGDTAGAMLGLMFALFIVLATQSQALDLQRETFQRLVLIGIIPAFIAVIVLALGAKEVYVKRSLSTTIPLKLTDLNRDFKFFMLIIAIFTLGNSSDAFLLLRAQERGLHVVSILGMLIMFNLIYALFASPFGMLSDRIGRKRLLIGGWLVYGLIYLGFALARTGAQIWLLYALYGLYYAAVEGTAKAYVADLVPSKQRGTAYGYYNATIGLMALPASLVAGALWQGVGTWTGFGASAPFFLGALLALMAVVLMAFHKH